MNTTTRRLSFIVRLVVLGGLIVSSQGCVRTSTHEAVKKELLETQAQLFREHQRVKDLRAVHVEVTGKMDEWVTKLSEASQRLENSSRNWDLVRDDLLRLKIEQEMQRQSLMKKAGEGFFRLESGAQQP